jgi:hypothetical protein
MPEYHSTSMTKVLIILGIYACTAFVICEEFDLMNLKFDLHAWCIMAFYRSLQIIGLWMIFLFLIFQTLRILCT